MKNSIITRTLFSILLSSFISLISYSFTSAQTIIGGTFAADTTLTAANSPYKLSSNININNCVLTIRDGVEIDLNGKTITVGYSSNPAIINASGAIFRNNYSATDKSIIFKNSSSGSIASCTLDNVYISIENGNPTVSGCTIKNVEYPFSFDGGSPNPEISNNTLISVTYEKIRLGSNFNITQNYTLRKYTLDYNAESSLSITGSTLTIESGVVIDLKTYNINLGSSGKPALLNAGGATIKTSSATEHYISYTYGSSGKIENCILDNIYVKVYEGHPELVSTTIKNVSLPVIFYEISSDITLSGISYQSVESVSIGLGSTYQINGNLTLKDYSIPYSLTASIYIYNGTLTISANCEINLNGNYLYVGKSSNPAGFLNAEGAVFSNSSDYDRYIKFDFGSGGNITGCTFDNVFLQIKNGVPLVTQSNFINTVKGIDNLSGIAFQAANNYWGDMTGPLHPTNPNGSGTGVSDNVLFTPWLTSFKIYGKESPAPFVSIVNNVFNLCTNEERELSITVTNSGGSVGTTFLDLSFSSNLDVIATGSDGQWSRYNKGDTIRGKTDGSLPSVKASYLLYEMRDNSFSGTQKTYRMIIKRTGRGDGWIKYRAGMSPSGIEPSYQPDNFSHSPVTGETDQQGWPSSVLSVREPLGATLSNIGRNNDYVYLNAVADSFGIRMASLPQSAFRVYENGVEQTGYFEVQPPDQGGGFRLVDIVFIMDNSGSMAEEQDSIKVNVQKFVNNLVNSGVDFSLGLCRYGLNGEPVIEDNGILTPDAEYFKNNVWTRNVTSGSKESGYYSIQLSASKFSFRPGSQKIFIIITDETPAQGTATINDALTTCTNNSISLYALTLSALFNKFSSVTEASGGACFSILSPFDSILTDISTQVAHTFLIRYKSGAVPVYGEKRDIELRISLADYTAKVYGTYIFGSEPSVVRTQATLDLHNKPRADLSPIKIYVSVTDHFEPFVKNVTLFHRVTGSSSSFTQISMTASDDTLYYANIPGGSVHQPGVDYYITATDGENTASDPTVSPIQNPYQIAVLPNTAPVINHIPVIAKDPGESVAIIANVNDITNYLNSVKLYYRKTGQLSYQIVNMSASNDTTFSANIPSGYVADGGVDYYIYAIDDLGVSSTFGTSDIPNQILVGNYTSNQASLSPVNGGPSANLVEVPTNGTGYLYLSMLAGTDSVSFDGDFDVNLIKSGGTSRVTGTFITHGLLRISVPASVFGNDSTYVFTVPSQLPIGDTVYSIITTPASFTAHKNKIEYERSWDVFAGGSIGANASAGSIGAGASVAAAKVSVSGQAGMGLKFTRDSNHNLKMDRRVEAGVGVGLEVPSINLGVDEVGISGITVQLMDKALLGQSMCFTDLNLDENTRKMAQTGFILETLSVGGVGLSPVVGILLSAIIAGLNEMSGVSDVFEDAQDEIYWGLGVEGSVGAGVSMNVGDLIKLTFAEASIGFAMNALYTDLYEAPTATGKISTAVNSGKSRQVTQAATFNFSALSVSPKLNDKDELKSGNLSLFDAGVGGEVAYKSEFDSNNTVTKLTVNLKGGGDVAIFGGSTSTYYDTEIDFPAEYVPVIRDGDTGLSGMVGGSGDIRLGPLSMASDGLDAMNEALNSQVGLPVRVTTTECRGNGLDLGLTIELDAALGVGLGLSVGINGSYFDEIQYPRKVSEIYPGNMNYLLYSASYSDSMAQDSFTGILRELLDGVIPLVKEAMLNLMTNISELIDAGIDFAVEVVSDVGETAGEVVGEVAGALDEGGEILISVLPVEITSVDIPFLKATGQRRITKMYSSPDVLYRVISAGKTTLVPSKTIMIGVSQAMSVGFIPEGSTSNVDSLPKPLDISMIIHEKNLVKNSFSLQDKNRVGLYYYDKTTRHWIKEQGILSADTLSASVNRTGAYMLGIEVDIAEDSEPPKIRDYGPIGTALTATPEIFVNVSTDEISGGIDFANTFITLNGETLAVSHNASNGSLYYKPSKALGIGSYEATFIVTDLSGKKAIKSFSFIIDKTAVNNEKPLIFSIDKPFPNPFNTDVTIGYNLPEREHVTICIYDVLGAKIKTLENSYRAPGKYRTVWNGKNEKGINVASGIYFYRISAGSNHGEGKLTLVK